MNKNLLKKAFVKGTPIALLAWLGYGVVASFFDDTVFEQMFKSRGIAVGLVAVAAVVGGIYYKLAKKEAPETVKQAA